MAWTRLLARAAPLLAHGCQILHITGKGKAVEVEDFGCAYRQMEFLAEGMGDALAAADLVISRAGLSTLTEIAALGKPSILVPMPHSHQNANARVFSSAGAAAVLNEEDLSGPLLAQKVMDLLADPLQLAAMSRRARDLMPRDAEKAIAGVVEAVANRGRSATPERPSAILRSQRCSLLTETPRTAAMTSGRTPGL